MRVKIWEVCSELVSELSKRILDFNFTNDLKQAKKLAVCVIEVELAIFSIGQIYPKENRIQSIPFLFYSNLLPSMIEQTKENQQILANVQILLPHWKVRRVVNQKILTYETLREIGLHVDFTHEEFKWKNLTHKDRKQNYKDILSGWLGFKNRKISILQTPEAEYWSNSESKFKKVPIPAYLRTFQSPKELDLEHVESSREPIIISISELLSTALEMDNLREKKGLSPMNWYARLKSLEFNKVGEQLEKVEAVKFEGTQHWVGPLSVGKSSLIEVATYYMAKIKNKKISIIVKDIQEMLSLIDRFDELGIIAVPIMSFRNRRDHVKQYLQSIDEEDMINQGLDIFQRRSFKYLTMGCPIMNEESLELPPCGSLIDPKVREETSKTKNKTCPFINHCQYHQIDRDLDNAQVYITNMNSILTQRVPVSRTSKEILFLEYILRVSSLIFIDESDRCQQISDETFIPNEAIKNDLGGWLTKIADEIKLVVRKTPSIQWHNSDVRDWLASLNQLEYAEREIRYLLENSGTKKDIKSFIGSQAFTGKQLLSRLASQLVSIKKDDGSYAWLVERETKEDKVKYEKYQALIGEFFSFYDAYKDDESEIQLTGSFIQSQLYHIAESSDFIQRRRMLEQFLKKMKFEYELVDSDFIELVNRFSFTLFVCYFEKRLYLLTELYSHVKDYLQIDKKTASKSIFYSLPRDYWGLVPINPVGTQFGFRYEYQKEDSQQGGELQIFRYLGIGRYILNRFSVLFGNVDGKSGAHTVLLSATSYAPHSSKYHIDIPIHYVICKEGRKQAKVQYEFIKTTKVSGKRNDDRLHALNEQIQFLLRNNYLEKILKRSPQGRERALLITGSYDEAIHCLESFKNTSFFQNRRVFVLVSGDEHKNNKWKDFYVDRQNVASFAKKGIQTVLIAPLLSLERGHNILTNINGEKVAAFYNLFYLVRPYPKPHDLSGMANLLNTFAMSAYQNKEFQRDALYEEMMAIKQKAHIIQREYFQQDYGYRSLGGLRDTLLMDTNTNCSQIEGRLFRGIEPQDAYVAFLDNSFSPDYAEGKKDSFKTSMLEGWKEILNRPFERTVDQEIMKILYGFRMDGLKNMKR